MSDTFVWVAVFAILSAVINAAGIFAIIKYKKWAEKIKTYFICFAAGVLISTPLMLALPQALQKPLCGIYGGWRIYIHGVFQ